MSKAVSKIVEEPGSGTLEIFPLPTNEAFLKELLTDIFTIFWDKIHFGTAVQGAVWEIRAPNAATKIGLLDGYLTVDFGHWHFHICIGEHRGSRKFPVSAELAQHRKTARAELYRNLKGDGSATSWGLRLFNGADEQQMTVFLPNPFISIEQKIVKEPIWEQLDMWDYLREKYLGLGPEETDRMAKKFIHG
jgi:hypothetical protein